MFKTLQRVGKAFMLPIAILPAAGLLLGIGGALSNPTTVAAYPVLDNRVLQTIFSVMSAAGNVVFANLALLLSIGLCIGLAKRDKGTAALAGIVGFLVMNATMTQLVQLTNPEGSIDTGVIGSLVIGAIAVWLHNRYYNIQLPPVLGFFGGSRFVPIVTAFAGLLVGFMFFLIWPPIQGWMVTAGEGIATLGPIGTFLYGFILRLSGAVGLHHMIYPMFWLTELGGVETVAGTQVVGAQKIFFAQMADPNHTGLFTEGTRYFAGRFDTMMFGLPGACLAMWHCVPKERRTKYTGLFLSVALTSFVTGITEPIEFMFLFVAPWLYVIHALFDGFSFLIADLLQIRIGNTFSGGVIDFTLFGILQGNDRTNWLWVLPVGVAWFFLYYFTFVFLIKRFRVATPGHLDDTEPDPATSKRGRGAAAPTADGTQGAQAEGAVAVAQDSGQTQLEKEAMLILEALGGEENLDDVDACITRLRVSVKDSDKVVRDALKQLGAAGVFDVKGGIQAVYGAKAILYKNAINDYLGIDD